MVDPPHRSKPRRRPNPGGNTTHFLQHPPPPTHTHKKKTMFLMYLAVQASYNPKMYIKTFVALEGKANTTGNAVEFLDSHRVGQQVFVTFRARLQLSTSDENACLGW